MFVSSWERSYKPQFLWCLEKFSDFGDVPRLHNFFVPILPNQERCSDVCSNLERFRATHSESAPLALAFVSPRSQTTGHR
jgi:hypothetical protein